LGEAEKIEQQTREQSGCQMWRDERKWRLTASKFGEICKATERRDLAKLSKSLFSPPHLTGDAVVHGKTYEKIAIEKFSETTGKKVEKCGLFIDLIDSFIAASPDGVVDGEDALLEVKCPFKGRDDEIRAGGSFPFLEIRDGDLRLKRNASYFFQVQGQMKVCGRGACYFVTYTHKDLLVEKILFDPSFYAENMADQLQNFYCNHYLPFIVSTL
jgi:predicted phage-related endonuclease